MIFFKRQTKMSKNYDLRLYNYLMKQKKQILSLVEEEQLEQSESIGIEAILGSNLLSNRASSLYMSTFKTYYEIKHGPQIDNILLIPNPNFTYSINMCELWKLLRFKMKQINSKLKMSDSVSDRRVIFFSLSVASAKTLNDAKEKIIEKDHSSLRNDIRQQVQRLRQNQLRRTKEMNEDFNQSTFFNKQISEKMNLGRQQLEILKQNLLKFNFKNEIQLRSYFQRVLSKQFRKLKENEQNLTEQTLKDSENTLHSAYSILLLSTYLTIYTSFRDWANNLDKNRKMNQFYLRHIIQSKGFGIIHRILDDAPIQTLLQETRGLQKVYFGY